MRPVFLDPTTPDAYPEATLEDATINVFIPAKTQTTVSAAQAAQAALIDEWDANQRKTVNKSKVIYPDDAAENTTANQQFNGYTKALKKVNGYQQARGSLIADIGQYCSYCELPLTSSLAVEHTLPKYWFPTSQLTWSNFLLACPVCNSVKGSNPNQKICDPPYTDSADAEVQIADIYAWPNSYWETYPDDSLLPVTLQTSASQALPLGQAATKRQRPTKPPDGMTWLDIGFAIIIGGQYLETTAGNQSPSRPIMTPVTVKIRAYGNDDNAAAIDETIQLVGLNNIKVNNASVSDLRVAYRSQAYARAQSMLLHFQDLLRNQLLMAAAPDIAYPLLELIVQSAAASGFWTVWVRVLSDIVVTGPDGSDVSAQSMLQAAFTGTADKTWIVGG